MKWLVFVGMLAFCFTVRAVDWIEKLKSPNVEIRREAVDRIQTLEDARIPEACLPLLTDEGRSIRRQAARAIGSRFAQVSPDRMPVFLQALQKCAEDGPEDVTLLCERAMGLLKRKFRGDAFSVSPDKRWVLFEERRLPMVADMKLEHPQMLRPVHPDPEMPSEDTVVQRGNLVEDLKHVTPLLKLMLTSDSVENLFKPHWHPKGEALALQPLIQRRFYRPIVLWRASDGAVRTWCARSFKQLYQSHFGKEFPRWSTTEDFVKWEGHKAVIRLHDCDDVGPETPYDPQPVFVSVDIDTWKIALEK